MARIKCTSSYCQNAEELHILASEGVQHVALQLDSSCEALCSCHLVAAQCLQAGNCLLLPAGIKEER